MTTALALDLARNSGWAVVMDGEILASGSWHLLDGVVVTGKAAVPLDVQHVLQIRALRSHVVQAINRFRPDVVAIEREFGRGTGTRLLVALFTAAQEAAYVSGLPTLSITVGQWRKHVHGSAGKTTDWYKSESLRLVPDAPDADAAEAALIGRYVCETVRMHAAPALGRAA